MHPRRAGREVVVERAGRDSRPSGAGRAAAGAARIALSTGMPKLGVAGTKSPSITSTWTRSAPLSRLGEGAAMSARSSARIDGASRIRELLRRSRPRPRPRPRLSARWPGSGTAAGSHRRHPFVALGLDVAELEAEPCSSRGAPGRNCGRRGRHHVALARRRHRQQQVDAGRRRDGGVGVRILLVTGRATRGREPARRGSARGRGRCRRSPPARPAASCP